MVFFVYPSPKFNGEPSLSKTVLGLKYTKIENKDKNKITVNKRIFFFNYIFHHVY
jgi:hypothetical protein